MKKGLTKIIAFALAASMVFGTVAFAQETDTGIPAEQNEMTMESETSAEADTEEVTKDETKTEDEAKTDVESEQEPEDNVTEETTENTIDVVEEVVAPVENVLAGTDVVQSETVQGAPMLLAMTYAQTEDWAQVFYNDMQDIIDTVRDWYAFDNAPKIVEIAREHQAKASSIMNEMGYANAFGAYRAAQSSIPNAEREVYNALDIAEFENLPSGLQKMFDLKLAELKAELLSIEDADTKASFLASCNDEMYEYVYESDPEEVEKIEALQNAIDEKNKLITDISTKAALNATAEEKEQIRRYNAEYSQKLNDAKSIEEVDRLYDEFRRLTVGTLQNDNLMEQVDPSFVAVKGITLDKTSASVKSGETVNLTATVNPENATYPEVTWNTSDTAIATVSNGTVTTIKAGAVTITAKAGDFTATCEIAVTDDTESGKPENIPVESLTLSETALSLKIGETKTLAVTVKPDNATNKTVQWTSDDESVATVTNGTVKAVKAGTATITATAGNVKATCTVTVSAVQTTIPVESIVLDKSTLDIKVGESANLTATINPENATNKDITWSTSNEDVATVVNGTVTAVKAGTTTITASVDGKAATCVVTVSNVRVTSVKIDKVEMVLFVDAEAKLNATVTPNNATLNTVTWSSDKADVVSVDANGNIKALKEGTATITATADGVSGTCLITVKARPVVKVEKVELDKVSISMKEDETVKLTATVTPEDATDKTVLWTTSDASIATVDTNGNVKALKAGKVTITAAAGDKKATCEITVTEKPFEYKILEGKDQKYTLGEDDTVTIKCNGEFSEFKGLKIDGNTVDEDDYTVKEGSTIVTLKESLLKTLAVGKHTITFVYDDAEVSTSLTIAQASTEDKKEEDKDDDNKQEDDKKDETMNNDSNDKDDSKPSSNSKEETGKKNSIQTGDNANIALWVSVALIAGATLMFALKKKEN